MTLRRLIWRGLVYHWRTGIVVVLGLAVATAVISGSLIVGDSVTASLREMALARLGAIDYVLTAPHLFRAQLARDLTDSPNVQNCVRRIVPIILTQGSCRNPATDAVLPSVTALGVDGEFWELYPNQTPPRLGGRQAAVNAALAADLGIKEGDGLILTVGRENVAPSGTVFPRRKPEETTRSTRLQVVAVLPDFGVGGFRLDAGTAIPRNVFISREWLAKQMGRGNQANTLLVESAQQAPQEVVPALEGALSTACTLADYGLRLVPHAQRRYISLQSARLLLRADQLAAAQQAAADCLCNTQLTSLYLATRIRNLSAEGGSAEIAYAVVAYVESESGFRFKACNRLPLSRGYAWLNSWAAEALRARLGDKLELTYLIPSPDGTYQDATLALKVGGIVGMWGAGADPGLSPDFEGITDAQRISDWRPPFPVDFTRITPRDEAYWEQYRAAPNAFVARETIRKMWAGGQGGESADWVTSVRLRPTGAHEINRVADGFSRAFMRHLEPADAGLAFQPVRAHMLAASRGTTDFSQLMLGMSLFLVASGVALAGTLLRLSADRRASEAGIMMACGCTAGTCARAILGEGLALTLAGSVLGLPLGVAYAWGMIIGLATWWRGAVGDTALRLHVSPSSLLIGGFTGGLVGLVAASRAIKSLRRRTTLELLSGWRSLAIAPGAHPSQGAVALPALLLVAAGGLLAMSAGGHFVPVHAAFFGVGLLLLVAGLVCTRLLLMRALRGRGTCRSLAALALRSAAANRGRSLLVIGLFASATFVIVAVATNTRDLSRIDTTRPDSGTGGFCLRAVSSVPLYYDLGSPAGRAQLGFTPQQEELMKGTEVVSFLASPGQDISCLNLSRPTHPRLLGVGRAMIARDGFLVRTAKSRGAGNPWTLLEEPMSDAVPAFGDADTVTWSLHSGLGRTYEVPDAAGRAVTLRFVGLMPRSIFAGEVLIADDHLKSLFPGVDAPRYFLVRTPPDRQEQVAAALRSALGAQGLEVRSTREILNSFLRVQNTYLLMFLALGGLGLLLGGIGTVTVILRNAFERRPEFALMLATGFHRNHLARWLLLENAGLLWAGTLLGMVSALVATGPTFASRESQVNWAALSSVLAAVMLVGLATSWLAARAVARGRLLDALREE